MTTRPTDCAVCAAPIQQAHLGRPRLYCGDQCRQAAKRARAADAAAARMLTTIGEGANHMTIDQNHTYAMRPERARAIARAILAANPLPETVDELDDTGRQWAEREARRHGITPTAFLHLARSAQAADEADAAEQDEARARARLTRRPGGVAHERRRDAEDV